MFLFWLCMWNLKHVERLEAGGHVKQTVSMYYTIATVSQATENFALKLQPEESEVVAW